MSKKQPQIFVSHSKLDKKIVASFDRIFARTGVKAMFMEFEQIRSPEWNSIRNAVNDSEAVFLLLGENVRSSIYTQNWISFEVGLSCALGKEVWVFEQADSHIDFPIPYLTDYMIYDLEVKDHFEYVKSVIERYGNSYFPSSGADHRRKRNIPTGRTIICDNCYLSYSEHGYALHPLRDYTKRTWRDLITSGDDEIIYICPSCRRIIWTVDV